jgi:hypothetical protein
MKSLHKKIGTPPGIVCVYSMVNYNISDIINSQIRGKTLFIHINKLKLCLATMMIFPV